MKCGVNLKPADLVPVLSYLFYKGKCRYCGERLSPQYPLVEGFNAFVWTILYIRYGLTVIFMKYAVLSGLLIIIALIDYYHKIIPDKLIFLGLLFAAVFHVFFPFKESYINGIIGFFIGGGLFLLIAVATNGAMGGGDIKLMAMLVFFLGWKHTILITILSFLTGALVSVVLLILKIKSRKDYVPFGPFIAMAAFITMYYGNEVISWYVHTVLG